MATKQEVALFEMPALPAEYKSFLEESANVAPRDTTPTLNPGGRKWTVIIDGKETVLMRKDSEGEQVPVQIFRGFIVAHNILRGRTYYASTFDAKKPGRPTCWSEDSVKPDDRVPATDKQNKVCNGCKQSVKGSAVADDGRETKACKEHQLVAIMPTQRLLTDDFPVLRLKLSITSIYDGKDQPHEQEGWYAWGPYLQHLLAIMPQNCHTARVETLIKFDTGSGINWPKLLFKAARHVTGEEYIRLVDIMREQKDHLTTMVSALMPAGALLPKAGGAEEEDEAPPAKVTDPEEEEAPAPKKSSAAPTRKPAAAEEEEAPKAKAKPKAADPEEEEAPAPKKAKPFEPEEDKHPEEDVPKGMKKKEPAKSDEVEKLAQAAKTPAKGNIKDLLADWS